MNREALAARIDQLQNMQRQQTERLERARQEVAAAVESLAIIRGGLQDCEYWSTKFAEQQKADAMNEIFAARQEVSNGVPAGVDG